MHFKYIIDAYQHPFKYIYIHTYIERDIYKSELVDVALINYDVVLYCLKRESKSHSLYR